MGRLQPVEPTRHPVNRKPATIEIFINFQRFSVVTQTVSAIVPETQTVVTGMRNYYGEIPEVFDFHEDKLKLVNFAMSLSE